MLKRILIVLVVVPIAIVLVALAVANRAPAAFTADPFNPGNPALTVQLPLFFLLFGALALGLVIGSFATWLKQGRYRRLARQREREAQTLREAQIGREAQAGREGPAGGPSSQLALPRH